MCSLQMMHKVVASEIFKDQKGSYPHSVGRLFLDSRLGKPSKYPPFTSVSKTQHSLTPFIASQNESKSASKSYRPSGVRKCRWDLTVRTMKKRSLVVICIPCFSQYGVSVVKYDRRGFKPRPRQLLLTNTFAVLVDRTKIKQRMDYTALRGENQPQRLTF